MLVLLSLYVERLSVNVQINETENIVLYKFLHLLNHVMYVLAATNSRIKLLEIKSVGRSEAIRRIGLCHVFKAVYHQRPILAAFLISTFLTLGVSQ